MITKSKPDTHLKTEKRRRGPMRRFSQKEVFEAALRLIDKEGYQEMTMRRLADEMGIGVMTLYGYVHTREEILKGSGDLVLCNVGQGLDSNASWDDQIASVIRDLYRVLQTHHRAVEMVMAESIAGPAHDRLRHLLLGILRKAGFPEQDAVDAVGALTSYALGFSIAQRTRPGVLAAFAVVPRRPLR